MASVSKQLIDAVVAGDAGGSALVPGDDDLASRMSAAMEHQEAARFEQCGNRACTYGQLMSQVFNATAKDTSDLYGTPDSAIALIEKYLPRVRIWEPCRGYGAIQMYLSARGHDVVGTDITTGTDALTSQVDDWDIAVTNPPWSLKGEFLERFYALGKPFAFLLPCDLVNGKRTKLFEQHGIQLIVPNWRVRYLRFDGEKPVEYGAPNTGSAWFCWKLNLPRDLIFVSRG